ncbi:TolC family protein [Zoogloea sp. LCSB751]|uniref:TolC family protein n=1 Tax=Zoogloea sp. LCSB751 TaxID=1965277 RepID=UPI000B4969F6|nr:TolC family protein [Zoogloea sp. LCSB751]
MKRHTHCSPEAATAPVGTTSFAQRLFNARGRVNSPLLMMLFPLAALAGPAADAPDLPPQAQVTSVLRSSPMVSAAGAMLEAEEARSRRLAAGPHEWTLRLTDQQRRVRTTPAERFNEVDVALERALRLPGKGELDRQLGAAGIASAKIGRGDALHEASRALLSGWFDWLREQSSAEQWRKQRDVLARQAGVVKRRVELGDAPRLEKLQADAALAQAEAQLAQAEGRAQVTAESLRRLYPALKLPDSVPEVAPEAVGQDAAKWVTAILEHNHELGVARAESLRARVGASRAEAERRPDPSVGVRVARERDGEERLIGLTLSLPLPGEGRRADADAAVASAQASAHREAGIQRRIEAEAAALYRRTTAARAGWLGQQAAAEALVRSADLSERAWQLGEGSLSDTLNARRLAHEARLAASLARLDASEARYRLLLDAHQLWALDMDDDEHGEHDHP